MAVSIKLSQLLQRTSLDRFNPNFLPIAVLIAMPLIMALFSREWLYTTIAYLDPWYNVGFFLYYHDPTFLADHYKLQRLSWILPGWILYHALGPLIANFALHVGALVVSTIFVYLTLVRLVARQSAFLVAVFLTVYIPFHGSGGWDYQTAGSAAYYAITLYAVTRAAQAEDPRNGLIAAGAAYAAALFATVHLINFLPVLAALYFVVGERHRTRVGVRTALSYGLIGFGGLTLALCMINLAVGRGLFFFWPLLKIVLERVADPAGQKPWLTPWATFLGTPKWFLYLLFPVVLSVVSTLRLAAGFMAISQLSAVRAFLLAQFVLLFLLWVLWQELGHIALAPDYFAHVLIIPAFLALAGLLGGRPESTSRVSSAMMIGSLLLSAVPALQGGIGPSILMSFGVWSETIVIALLVSVAAAVLLAAIVSLERVLPLFMLVAVAGFTFSYLQGQTNFSATQADRYWTRYGCVQHAKAFREIIKLFDTLAAEGAGPGRAMIWRGPEGTRTFAPECIFDLNNLRGSIHSAGVGNLGFATDSHPSQIPDDYIANILDGGLVVAIVQEDKDADGLIERAAVAGKKLALVRRQPINPGKVPALLLIYRSVGKT